MIMTGFYHRYITVLYCITVVYLVKMNHAAHLLRQLTDPNALQLALERRYGWIDDDKTPLVVYV